MSRPDTKFNITNKLTKESKFGWRLLHSIHIMLYVAQTNDYLFLKKGKGKSNDFYHSTFFPVTLTPIWILIPRHFEDGFKFLREYSYQILKTLF